MIWDNIGDKFIGSKIVKVGSDVVTLQYKKHPIHYRWRYLERKRYLSPKERYEREKERIELFFNKGLNVPKLIESDDEKLILKIEKLELEKLLDVFYKPEPDVSCDTKLELYAGGLNLLYAIHNLEKVPITKRKHGDTRLKNFYRLKEIPEDRKERGLVYTTDFEEERVVKLGKKRNPELEQILDVLVFTANTVGVFNKLHPEKVSSIFSILKEVYGLIKFPFDPRDYAYFKSRFRVPGYFFKEFSLKEK